MNIKCKFSRIAIEPTPCFSNTRASHGRLWLSKRNPHSLQKSQFLRIEEYSQKIVNKKNGEKRGNIFGILKEAERELSHCKHVDNPQKPEIIGLSPKQMMKELNQLCESVKINNKKIRKDARLLAAGVVSYPIKKSSREFCKKKYSQWEEVTIEYLKAKFSDNFKSAIIHKDESNYHIHFYCYNSKDLNMRTFHPAFIAEDAEKNRKKKKTAFKKGLSDFQDEYHRLVSSYFNFERKTVQRERRSRKTQLAFKAVEQTKLDKDREIYELKNKNRKLIKIVREYKHVIKNLKHRLSVSLGFDNVSLSIK